MLPRLSLAYVLSAIQDCTTLVLMHRNSIELTFPNVFNKINKQYISGPKMHSKLTKHKAGSENTLMVRATNTGNDMLNSKKDLKHK